MSSVSSQISWPAKLDKISKNRLRKLAFYRLGRVSSAITIYDVHYTLTNDPKLIISIVYPTKPTKLQPIVFRIWKIGSRNRDYSEIAYIPSTVTDKHFVELTKLIRKQLSKSRSRLAQNREQLLTQLVRTVLAYLVDHNLIDKKIARKLEQQLLSPQFRQIREQFSKLLSASFTADGDQLISESNSILSRLFEPIKTIYRFAISLDKFTWSILGLISAGRWYLYLYKQLRYKLLSRKLEQYRTNELEYLFGKDRDIHSKAFEDYQELIYYIELLLKNERFNGLLVCGPGGTGKTFVVMRTLLLSGLKQGQDFIVVKGTARSNPVAVLTKLMFEHNDKLIVLDDFDVKWSDELIGLLKAATDTYRVRIIDVPNELKVSREFDINVDKFQFKGKLLIITNKPKNEIPQPIISRMIGVEVKFSVDKFLQVIRKHLERIAPNVAMSDKLRVYNYLVELHKKRKLKKLDFRIFQQCIDIYQIDPKNWQKIIQKLVSK